MKVCSIQELVHWEFLSRHMLPLYIYGHDFLFTLSHDVTNNNEAA